MFQTGIDMPALQTIRRHDIMPAVPTARSWRRACLACGIVSSLFYAAMINALTGFKDVDDDALEVLRSVNASRREIFFRLRLPNSLPHLFAAAKICAPLAVLGAVFSEMNNSKEGLGNVILQSSHNIRMVRV